MVFLRAYLVERKGAHAVCSQLRCVDHRHLNHPVGFRPSARPILVALHLQSHQFVLVERQLKVFSRHDFVARRAVTLDFSSRRVIITMVQVLCSHTILQKSLSVSGRGPCVAI